MLASSRAWKKFLGSLRNTRGARGNYSRLYAKSSFTSYHHAKPFGAGAYTNHGALIAGVTPISTSSLSRPLRGGVSKPDQSQAVFRAQPPVTDTLRSRSRKSQLSG